MTKKNNHKTVGVGGDLLGSSHATPLLMDSSSTPFRYEGGILLTSTHLLWNSTKTADPTCNIPPHSDPLFGNMQVKPSLQMCR